MHNSFNSADVPGLIQQQMAFAARVRDPANTPLPKGVEARSMAVYEELVYNNIHTLLCNAFPVLRRISSDNDWHQRVRDFLTHHRSQTPLFPELPREFIHYLEQTRTPQKKDYPFLLELVHYEWTELALSISEARITDTQVDRTGSLLDGVPVLSPLVCLCSYRYPVHRISPDYLPLEPEAERTHLLIYRDRAHQIGFLQLNPVTAQLLQALQPNKGQCGRSLLQELAKTLQHPNPDTVIQGGEQILQDLMARDVILGTQTTGVKQ